MSSPTAIAPRHALRKEDEVDRRVETPPCQARRPLPHGTHFETTQMQKIGLLTFNRSQDDLLRCTRTNGMVGSQARLVSRDRLTWWQEENSEVFGTRREDDRRRVRWQVHGKRLPVVNFFHIDIPLSTLLQRHGTYQADRAR